MRALHSNPGGRNDIHPAAGARTEALRFAVRLKRQRAAHVQTPTSKWDVLRRQGRGAESRGLTAIAKEAESFKLRTLGKVWREWNALCEILTVSSVYHLSTPSSAQ